MPADAPHNCIPAGIEITDATAPLPPAYPFSGWWEPLHQSGCPESYQPDAAHMQSRRVSRQGGGHKGPHLWCVSPPPPSTQVSITITVAVTFCESEDYSRGWPWLWIYCDFITVKWKGYLACYCKSSRLVPKELRNINRSSHCSTKQRIRTPGWNIIATVEFLLFSKSLSQSVIGCYEAAFEDNFPRTFL